MDLNLITLNTQGRLDFDFVPDMKDYKSPDILGLENLRVKGSIIDNGTDEYEITLHITGTGIYRSAINLGEVKQKIDIEYSDFIKNLPDIYKKSANTLDILPIIWENILLEIPIRAVNSSDTFAKTQGDGWEIVSE